MTKNLFLVAGTLACLVVTGAAVMDTWRYVATAADLAPYSSWSITCTGKA